MNLLAALEQDAGRTDSYGVAWMVTGVDDVNRLLTAHHYLGPVSGGVRLIVGGYVGSELVAAQVWKHPTARRLPSSGVLELSRWCLTPMAGTNAGSRQHAAAVRIIRSLMPDVSALVSYSDPSAGHTGALYRACNWLWAPAWNRLRPPPSRGGSWDGVTLQEVKDRWVFPMRRRLTEEVLSAFRIDDTAAIRHFIRTDEWDRCRRWPTLVPWNEYGVEAAA